MVILGIDEVGRGCWAGPLVAAAVALDVPIEGLRDSKKLSKKKREALDILIREQALGFGIGWVSPAEVDEIGLTKAVQLAMLRAVKQISCRYDAIIIDGNINYFANVRGLKTEQVEAVIKADDSYPAVSAASIIAKVARDKYMTERAADYPAYNFGCNVGYGTSDHSTALAAYGVTELHRLSYAPVKKVISNVQL